MIIIYLLIELINILIIIINFSCLINLFCIMPLDNLAKSHFTTEEKQ